MTKYSGRSLTPASILIGTIGAILVAASSFYVVLKFGALPWPTIMVTLISMSALGLFGRKDSGEITVTHTIMSAGSMVAGGVAFTVPGYLLLGGKLENIDKSLFLITILTGSVLGAVLSFIFRKKLIEEDKLEFPIGDAAYNLVKSGKNKKNMKTVTLGMLFSTVVAVLRDYSFQKGKAPFIPTVYSIKNGLFSFYVSPLLLGVGYILGFMNTFIWFLGGAVTYLIAQPLSVYYNIKDFDIMKNSFGMGFVIGIGTSVIVKIIISTKRENKYKRIKNDNINIKIILGVFSVAAVALISFVYKLPLFLSFVLILICILCTVIAGYTTGKTGINPMEIYAIVTILVISFLNVLLNGLNIGGIRFSTNINLLILFLLACIVAVACGLAGDILNDFKSGFKMKVSPGEQFAGELIGAVVSSFVVAFLFFIFFDVYKNIGPKENSELIVLQASIVASIIKGIPFINIFWIGFGAGFTLNMLNLPVLTFGIGIYLPFYLTLPVFAGGLLSLIASRISQKFSSNMLLFSNGLMSGEAIVGVILSILAYIKLFI
ncbi:OPT/YSL family transporter [Pseudoleptotrichia goodfellowii]|uniref:Putative oligopeptide transporter, OPT family n=1 Tax=Pseudoleptotrichia goodfellowii F0264 TaxID=596323 RepID=D0GLN9_9FUSO|nr:OPT/YSL family transporter [Pseudoleptotrichia goodfellowii]EEY34977.1 putative oligopeptide transporter, OPT family [Pseudoleptotrichia goodfellowii F0264]